MASTEEGTHKLSDGIELYTKTWKPAGEPIAAVVFIHGFSDHANRYKDFFPKLNAAGILVHSFDQRGWGRSVKQDSQKGLTGTTQQVLSDITSVIQSHLPSPVPLFLMGHSMGGQETLYFAAEGPDEVKNQLRGFIVMSPLIRLHPGSEPNRVTVMAGRLVGRLLPSRQMISKLDAGFMSHDDALNKDWEADELCHDTGTLEGLAGMLSRGEELDRGKVVIKDRDGLHMLLAHGTEDKVTSHEATKKLFGERLNIKNKTLKLYEGNYHCLHADLDKDKFTADVVDFIATLAKNQQTNPEPQSKL